MIQLFKDLINEHGSSDILKERLGLAIDQYSILEKERDVLKLENENLKIENKKLSEKIAIYEKTAKKMPNMRFDPGYTPDRNMI